MPLYEYKCAKCGKTFEVIQKFADAPLTVHEECGGTVERLFSAPAFHLKGTGWYATDYAKGSSRPAESKSNGDAKGDKAESKPASTETKTESKPAETATKSESKT
jgi:putative FmdB family regulatory protein